MADLDWAGAGRKLLGDDRLEDIESEVAIGERLRTDALPGKLGVGRCIEHRTRTVRLGNPAGELCLRHRAHAEGHVGKSVAAELRRLAEELSRTIRLQMKLRHHAIHRIDHAAEPRNEEHIHDARRGEREVHGHASRDHQAVYAGHVLSRVNEEPLPVERDHLHVKGFTVSGQGISRIELMGADPDDAPQKKDHEGGDRPYDELDAPGVSKVRTVASLAVGCAKPPRDGQCGNQSRDDDGEHDRQRIQKNDILGAGNPAGRGEHTRGASAKPEQESQRNPMHRVRREPSKTRRCGIRVRDEHVLTPERHHNAAPVLRFRAHDGRRECRMPMACPDYSGGGAQQL